MVNSKQKGKNGELEWAQFCRTFGFTEARRGVQYSGIGGDDVVGIPGCHIEVKRVQNLSIHKAMKQSVDECKGQTPIVAHRKNNTDWLVTMLAKDWFKLYKGE